ncbi:MAG: MAPEG family protein [Gammaproteobacteria bacterium]|nr:MAPEG family protein [Gammaproteobacteria bacterium]
MVVTPLYAGLLALWFLVLSYRVVGGRRQGVSLGDGGSESMLRLIRGQANFAEYVPLILLLMALLELGGFPHLWLHALGVTLLVARLLHGYAFGFTQRWMFGRFWGTALTFALLLVCGLLNLYQFAHGPLSP